MLFPDLKPHQYAGADESFRKFMHCEWDGVPAGADGPVNVSIAPGGSKLGKPRGNGGRG